MCLFPLSLLHMWKGPIARSTHRGPQAAQLAQDVQNSRFPRANSPDRSSDQSLD